MRDKLQALVDHINKVKPDIAVSNMVAHSVCDLVIEELESILATEPPAVTVRAGWVCKGWIGMHWTSEKPKWSESLGWSCFDDALIVDECIIDPWPDKPNGGPECLLEVK